MPLEAVALAVAAVLREELQAPFLRPSHDMELADLPGWDSVSMSCVMIALEGRFGIAFDGAEIEELSTFDKLVAVISAKSRSV